MDRLTAEFRSELKGNRLTGHAAVFNQVAELRGHYESIAPTAFDAALRSSDVPFLINHDPTQLLGRTSSGTLSLHTDDKGLAFELELPDTQLGRDVRHLVERGDLNKMSFGFSPGEDKWETTKDGKQLRTHTSLRRVLDVSLATLPVYEGTDVMLRTLDLETVPVSNRTKLLRAKIARLSALGGR